MPLSQNVLHIDDGDYVRIVLPPGHRGVDHISTRCLATAYHRGLTLDDVLAQHTMHLLGWSDHVVQPPWVPLLDEATDDMRLIQMVKYKTPVLPDVPTFQRQRQCRVLGQDLDTMPMDKVEMEIEYPPLPEQEELLPLERDIGTQPFAIQFMYDWWTQVTGHLAEQAPTQLVISTWFLDHPQHLRCEAAREVALQQDFTTWMAQIVETWDDLIDPIWPVNLHIVQPPAPVTRDRAVEQMQILVIQRSMPDQSANLFTVLDNALAGYRIDFATFGPAHIHKEAVIEAANYQHKCYPERSHLQCMTWHGDFELRGRIALRNRHGLSFLLVYNQLREPDQRPEEVDLWNEDDSEDAALLQYDMKKPQPTTLLLNELVPHRTVVRLLSPVPHLQLPDPLEVQFPGSEQDVCAELLNWGHNCTVRQCCHQPLYFCIPANEEYPWSPEGYHYAFCHDDPADLQGVFLHSQAHKLDEMATMRLLCGLGYDRAVVLQTQNLMENWYCILFHHREPAVQVPIVQERQKSAWPARGPQKRTSQKLYPELTSYVPDALCQVNTCFGPNEVRELLASGHDILNTNFDVLHLAEELRTELEQYTIQPLTDVSQLDSYHRLLIYTDGSSIPAMRRLPPERADELGHPDTWSFVVIGEEYLDDFHSKLNIFGWTSQPVRYTPGGSAYTGMQRTGSDLAERSALIAAACWRLSIDHAIATVFWLRFGTKWRTSSRYHRNCGP